MSAPSFNESSQHIQQVNPSSNSSQLSASTGMFTNMILNDDPTYDYQTPSSFSSGQSPSTNSAIVVTAQFPLAHSVSSTGQPSQPQVINKLTTNPSQTYVSSASGVTMVSDMISRNSDEGQQPTTNQVTFVRSSPGPTSSTETEYEQQIISRSKMFFSILKSVGDKFNTTPEVYESLSNLINGSITQQACQDRLKELLRFNDSSRDTVATFLNDLLPIFRRQILNDRFDYSLLPVSCDKEKVRLALIQAKNLSNAGVPITTGGLDGSIRLVSPLQQVRPISVAPTIPNTSQHFVRAPGQITYVRTSPLPNSQLQPNYRHIQPRPLAVSNPPTRVTQYPANPSQTIVNGSGVTNFSNTSQTSLRVLRMPQPQPPINGSQPTRIFSGANPPIRSSKPVYITGNLNQSSSAKSTVVSHMPPPQKKLASDGTLMDATSQNISSSIIRPVQANPPSIAHAANASDIQMKWRGAIRARTETYLSKQRSTAPTSLSYSPYLHNMSLTLADDAIEALQQAAQTFLRDMLSNLAMQARARSYHVSKHALGLDAGTSGFIDNTQAQLNFLKDVDKAEQKRIHLQDQENCRRAAQSRSREMDAETQQMRDRYREMANAKQELEDMRASNLTAQNALGGSQKPRAWEQAPVKDTIIPFRSLTSGVGSSLDRPVGVADEGIENPSLNPMASGTYARISSGGVAIRPTGVLPRYRLQHDDLVRYIREQRLLNETSAFQKVLSRQLNKH